jgi:hypothetical protein
MSESIYDGMKYIYAEQLKGKAVVMTIKSVTGGVEFCDSMGKKSKGFDIAFEGTAKMLGVTGVTVRRQLFMATGTENPAAMAGKRITLYPVASAKAATGQAIRIRGAEQAKRGAGQPGGMVGAPQAEKPQEQAQTADGDGDAGIDADVEAVL